MTSSVPSGYSAPSLSRIRALLMAGVIGLSLGVFGYPPVAQAETLQEALVAAYQSNPRLMAERARVREIDENYIQARAQGRPTSSLVGSLGYTHARSPGVNALGQATGGISTFTSEPSSLQLQVIQPLYQGGRVRALKAQAKAGILAAREGLRGAEQNLFLSVATAYSDVLRDEQAARIRRSNVRVLTRQLSAATARFDVGEGTRTDIAQARTRLAGAEIGLAQADAQLQVSRANFIRNAGHTPEDLQTPPTFILPATLEDAMRLGRANSPQLIAAMFNEEAAEAAINVARSASRPTVSLSGTGQRVRRQISGIPRAESASIAAQVSIPIFAGGLNKSRVRAAKHARTRVMFETRDTERAVDQAVAQIWAQLEAARLSYAASQTQVEAADFAFQGVVLEQDVGTRSTLDVLNAEQEVLNAKLASINAGAAVQVAEYQLLTTIGAFDTVALTLPVDAYDPAQNFEAVKYRGLNEAVDKYVPEMLKKAGQDVSKAAGDVIEAVSDGL